MANEKVYQAKLSLKEKALANIKTEISMTSKTIKDLLSIVDDITVEADKQEVENELETLKINLAENTTKKESLEKEIQEIKDAIEDMQEGNDQNTNTNTNKGGVREMKASTKRSIKRFVQTKGEDKGTLETSKDGVLVPDEAVVSHMQKVERLDLTDYVRIVETLRADGKYGILKKSENKYTAVTELASKEAPTPSFIEMEYAIKTYRGSLPISQEMVEDADFDVTLLITEYLDELGVNTKNSEIVSKLKTATAKAVTGLDGIKTLFNNDISDMYNAKAYVSTSLFNELDSLKDTSGRYLLQDDVSVKSGKRIRAKEVVVIPDTLIGTAKGDLVGFIGDMHEFVTLFDRNKTTIKWVDNDVYSQVLNSSIRFDTAVGDTQAGFYVTYTKAV